MTGPSTGPARRPTGGAGGDRSAPPAALVLGSGRLVGVLAAALEAAGREVIEDDPAAVAEVGLVVVCGPASEVDEVVTGLVRTDRLRSRHRVVHTAAAPGLEPLHRAALAGAGTAACHPALRAADAAELEGVGWAVTAGQDDLSWARQLVEELGGRPVVVRDEGRLLYAAGVTAASEGVGAAVALARQLMLAAAVDEPERLLDPLLRAGVGEVLRAGAVALDGPVARGDARTVSSHLQALEADAPRLAAVYRPVFRAVLEQLRPALEPEVARRLEDALGRAEQRPSRDEPEGSD